MCEKKIIINMSSHSEAIFRVKDLFFFVGARNSIYFVNIKFVPSPTFTLTTPQKPKNGKNRQIRSFTKMYIHKYIQL